MKKLRSKKGYVQIKATDLEKLALGADNDISTVSEDDHTPWMKKQQAAIDRANKILREYRDERERFKNENQT